MHGYEINMRLDRRTGEHFAVIPSSYGDRRGRYYMAIGESDGCWVELTPEYLTRCTVTVTTYPEWLKRNVDRNLGYMLNTVSKLRG